MILKTKGIGERSSVKFNRLVIVLLLLIPLIVGVWYEASLRAVNAESEKRKMLVIVKGQATDKILSKLKEDELIRSELAVKIYLYLNKEQGSLQAGTFELSQKMSVTEIVDTLKTGSFDVWVTIPEGWRAEQVVDQLVDQGLVDGSAKAETYKVLAKEEGRLFPDTYLFAKDSSLENIKQKMLDNFEKRTAGLNTEEADLVLASLVEREAKDDKDRPMIAGVIKNRLNIGMPLQIDATLQYVMDNKRPIGADWWQTPVVTDKKVKSPFNTYLNVGLPPAPICSSGLSSIKAALSPTKSDYLYYVSEDNGITHYAKTLEEHNANVAKYLK